METLFAILFTFSIPCLVIGLIRPKTFGKIPYLNKHLTRSWLGKFFGLLLVGSLVIFSIISEDVTKDEAFSPPVILDKPAGHEEGGLIIDVATDYLEDEQLHDVNIEPEPEIASSETEVIEETESKPGIYSEPIQDVSKIDFYTVDRVVDGDTVDVVMDGVVERIRLIGIDTPETVHPSEPVECFGIEASNKAKELLGGKKVSLEIDETQGEVDKYGRLLRHVFLEDGTNFSLLMIREGYAYEYTYDMPYLYQSDYKNAEREAREGLVGLWGAVCDEVEEEVMPVVINDAVDEGGGECLIKGNISSKDDEKIYHIPGCNSYNQTIISESKGERWFCSEQEAVDAGWRIALNCL